MFRIFSILILILLIKFSFSQIGFYYPYFPYEPDESTEWKWQVSAFANEASNSNAFTNEFFNTANKSKFLDKELINTQIENMNDYILAGQIRNIGVGAKINSKKNKGNKYLYLGIEHRRYLDIYLDDDLIELLLLGNKPFAGETLKATDSKYYSIYFNQLKGGMGYRFGTSEAIRHLTWNLALNIGQNYDYIEVQNSTLYTDPDGDFLDVTASANTKLSDTVWAEVYQMNGLGLSADVEYSYTKPGDFHFDLNLKNLGFIFWNGDTFIGEIDTSFVFDGVGVDTTSSQNDNLPDDYSYKSLRRILFKDPESSSFTTGLPVSLRFSAGKYFASNQFYAGLNGTYYPFLNAKFMFEFFATWNYKNKLYLTPVVLYSSYAKVNYGLCLGVNIHKKVRIHVGSGYLNSMFNKNELLGKGGFVRLTFIN